LRLSPTRIVETGQHEELRLCLNRRDGSRERKALITGAAQGWGQRRHTLLARHGAQGRALPNQYAGVERSRRAINAAVRRKYRNAVRRDVRDEISGSMFWRAPSLRWGLSVSSTHAGIIGPGNIEELSFADWTCGSGDMSTGISSVNTGEISSSK